MSLIDDEDLRKQEENLIKDIIGKVSRVQNLSITLTANLGIALMKVRDILTLKEGSVIKLDKLAGDALDMSMNGHNFAYGEIVIINEHYGVRLTDVLPTEHLDKI